MVISSSKVNMAASRSYTAKEERASVRAGNVLTLRAVPAYTISGADFKQKLNTASSRSWKLDTQTAHYGSSALGSFGGVSIYDRVNSQRDERSIDEIRKQSVSYFLLRIRELFEAHRQRVFGQASASYESSGQLIYSQIDAYSYEESEQTDFATTGKVVTADGREIDFDVSVSMSRKFAEYYEDRMDIYAPPQNVSLTDPLVINLDDGIAEVSDQKFFFDIDADGTLDEISRLGSGSGYLALDQNGDGIINDGSELFGTRSGNGFADLAAYDEDGNGWIDEADPIFEKLKIWVTDASGKQTLYSLKDKGVGAICLQNLSTDFDLKSEKDNALNARIRKSGFFLYENGLAGTVQHVDLAVNAAG